MEENLWETSIFSIFISLDCFSCDKKHLLLFLTKYFIILSCKSIFNTVYIQKLKSPIIAPQLSMPRFPHMSFTPSLNPTLGLL